MFSPIPRVFYKNIVEKRFKKVKIKGCILNTVNRVVYTVWTPKRTHTQYKFNFINTMFNKKHLF